MSRLWLVVALQLVLAWVLFQLGTESAAVALTLSLSAVGALRGVRETPGKGQPVGSAFLEDTRQGSRDARGAHSTGTLRRIVMRTALSDATIAGRPPTPTSRRSVPGRPRR